MFFVWENNGRERVFDMRAKKALSKLKKAIKGQLPENFHKLGELRDARRLADVHFVIYNLHGSPGFEKFEIKTVI